MTSLPISMQLFRNSVAIVTATIFLAGNVSAAETEEAGFASFPRLSMELALKLAKASIDACRKENVNVAVTVVDRGGHPQVILRDTRTLDLALTISQQKAYTALSFNAPTSQLIDQFQGIYSVAKVDGVLVAPGGVPITGAASAILGGVGVSGAPSGLTDEKCAQAGIEAIRFELENF